MTTETLLTRHAEATSKLSDIQSNAQLKLDLVLGFLPYSERLKGRYFYQKPNRHKLEFDDAPGYFDKAPSLFKWDLPSTEKYKTKILEGEPNVHRLIFLPKNSDSSTLNITCFFDADSYRLLKQETTYRDGGVVNLQFNYKDDTELPVLDQVDAAVTIPAYKLTGQATITFSDQKINEGLDATIFPETEK